ncbi:DNA polymerase [Acinetobacter phage SH-Ab 15599]|nr:DNA polymerase [Acinetobacter phage SH-Ab 15599]
MAQQFNMGIETLVPWGITEKILDALAQEMDDIPEEEQTQYTRLYAQRFRERKGIWDIYFEAPYQFQTLKRLKVCMAPNLAMFKTEKPSLLRRVFKDLYDTRKVIKKAMKDDERSLESFKKKYLDEQLEKTEAYYKEYDVWETKIQNGDSNQHAHKIAANAGYGAIANENFADHFEIRIAEAITTAGQCSTRHIMFKLNEWINKTYNLEGDHCFYGDTDSIYTEFKGVVKASGWDELSDSEITDKLDELMTTTIEPLYIQWAEELASSYNCPINALFFKREAIAMVAIFTTKKRYAMLLTDNEGVRYATPKLKIVGLEARKSNYPMFCREWMKTGYQLALEEKKTELHDFVAKCEVEFMKSRNINEYGAAQNINNIEDYLSNGVAVKGTPYHVKGAINHNTLLTKVDAPQIMPLRSGNKYYVLPLRKGSPFGMEVIAYDDQLPKEFNLEKFIDKDAAFSKCFINPLTNFLVAIKWEAKAPTSFSLNSLF